MFRGGRSGGKVVHAHHLGSIELHSGEKEEGKRRKQKEQQKREVEKKVGKGEGVVPDWLIRTHRYERNVFPVFAFASSFCS